MASLSEMAVGYRESAKLLKAKVAELRSILASEENKLNRYRLKRKINNLESLSREMTCTAYKLEHYYDRAGDK